MTTRRSQSYFIAALVGVLAYASGAYHSVSYADVTASGLSTTVTPAGGVYDITGGTRPNNGTNLFHSFGNFSLDAPESANFLNDSGLATTNILSRVTGGPSNIFGTIDTSDFGGANLFLMNPAGILFGPTAQLNVGGSFHATTADYIKLNDGGVFYAALAQPTVLSVAAPSAFGFLAANPTGIDVNTSSGFIGGLGQTLSFVGGPVNVGAADGSAPGYVFEPGGRVNLVSVASPGEATFDGTGFNVDGFAQLGNVNIRGASIVDGKDVFVRGGQLTIDEGIILPNVSFYLLGGPAPDGGEVNVEVTGAVNITGTDVDPLTETPPGIFVFSGDFFDVPTVAGKVPDVNIKADSVSISGFAGIQSDRVGPGEPGNVVVNADTVNVTSGGSIVAFNLWEGSGGNIIINARDVNVSGDGSPTPTGFEGIASQGLFHPAFGVSVDPALTNGDSGSIFLNLAGNLSVNGLGTIATDSLNLGNAGNITVNAVDVLLTGTGTGIAADGLIGTQTIFGGDAGDLTINASGKIDIQGGFRVSSSTFSSGNAGDVNLTAGESITLSGENTRILGRTNQPPDSTLDFAFGLFTGEDYATLKQLTTDILGIPDPNMFDVLLLLRELGFLELTDQQLLPGDAGRISLDTPLLTLNAGTTIETSTGWDGNAGGVQANVSSLSLNDGARIRSSSGIELLEADGTLIGPQVGSGNAGSVELNATGDISISGTNTAVSTTTFGDGDAGNVSLGASEVNVQGGGSVTSESGGTLAGQFLVGAGNAGTVTITATGPNTLTITGKGSTVSTTTSGAGAGGDISLVSAGNAEILNGGSVTADSEGTGNTGAIEITAGNSIILNKGTISTRAETSDGGNIKLTAPNIVQLTKSQITTSVESGEGGGGNINIDPQFITLNSSQITANAFGGPGGNISLTANNFVPSADSTVQASSALSTQGTIVIESPENDIAGSISQLPQSIVDVSGLLPERCAARGTGGAQSSFVVAGRGGLPTNPDNYLPSFGAGSAPMKTGGTARSEMSLSELGYSNQTTVAMAGWGCLR